MKHRLTTFAPLPLLAALVLSPGVAQAQVSVDSKALDQLSAPAKPPVHPAAKPAEHRPVEHRPVEHHAAEHHPAATTAAARPAPKPQAAAPAHPAAPPPSIPAAAPRPALVPPPAPIVATRPATPPPVPPVVADAPGLASKINGGMRITFGTDRSDLNAVTEAAIRSMAHVAQALPTSPVNVLAYAAGTPDDPSTPRRLALSRALAARAILVNEGIPSTRIYVRALGATSMPDLPSDRVDVVVGPAPDSAPPPTPTPASATGEAGK